jgi:hypothetical protein
MRNFLRTASIALACALVAFSCASERDPRAQGPGGGRDGGRSPDEAEMTLMRLKGIIDISDTNQALALSKEQIQTILPVLKSWKANVASVSASEAEAYAAKIVATLTDEQKAFKPKAPNDAERGPDPRTQGGGRPGGQPPSGQGGPGQSGGNHLSALLDELIETLMAF